MFKPDFLPSAVTRNVSENLSYPTRSRSSDSIKAETPQENSQYIENQGQFGMFSTQEVFLGDDLTVIQYNIVSQVTCAP